MKLKNYPIKINPKTRVTMFKRRRKQRKKREKYAKIKAQEGYQSIRKENIFYL